MIGNAPSSASTLTVNSRTTSIDGQHQQLFLRGHSCAPSIGGVQTGSTDRRSNGSRVSACSDFDYVCPYAGCAQSFLHMSRLQQHFTQRHVLGGAAFDNPLTERNSAQFPLRRHLNDSSLLGFVVGHPHFVPYLNQSRTPPFTPHVGLSLSKGIVSSLISLPSSSSSRSSAEYDSDSDFTDEEDDGRGATRHGVSSNVKKMIKYLLCKIQWHLYSSSVIHSASTVTSDLRANESSALHLDDPSLYSRIKRRAITHSVLETVDDGHRKKRRKVKTASGAGTMLLCRFACPFYKHDPQLYGSRESCAGPGWPTVHKMKEHLRFAHAEPVQCPHCYIVVETNADLKHHVGTEPCPVAEPRPMQEISQEQLNILRKRAAPCRLEEDKWIDVYRLFFPGVLDANLPTPYYDNEMPTDRSRQFRRDLLISVRAELLSVARRVSDQVEKHLLKNVAAIVQQCQRQLLTSRQVMLQNTPDRTPKMTPRQRSLRFRAHLSGCRTPSPLQTGASEPDETYHGVTDDKLFHVDWNSLFADPNNDVTPLSSAMPHSQSLSRSSNSREV